MCLAEWLTAGQRSQLCCSKILPELTPWIRYRVSPAAPDSCRVWNMCSELDGASRIRTDLECLDARQGHPSRTRCTAACKRGRAFVHSSSSQRGPQLAHSPRQRMRGNCKCDLRFLLSHHDCSSTGRLEHLPSPSSRTPTTDERPMKP